MNKFPKDELTEEQVKAGREAAKVLGITEEQFQEGTMCVYQIFLQLTGGKIKNHMILANAVDTGLINYPAQAKIFFGIKVFEAYMERQSSPAYMMEELLNLLKNPS